MAVPVEGATCQPEKRWKRETFPFQSTAFAHDLRSQQLAGKTAAQATMSSLEVIVGVASGMKLAADLVAEQSLVDLALVKVPSTG